MSLGSSTKRNFGSKNALAAALSGLDVARYRLEQVEPASNMCLTNGPVAQGSGGAAAGECPAYVGDLGNGTMFGYYVTPALVPGATCAGQAIAASSSSSRCITAYGTSNGVTRRAQSLVRSDQTAATLFPINGILGLSKVDVNQHSFDADILGSVASNGAFKLKHCPNSITGITGWKPGPTATVDEDCEGNLTSDPPRSIPWTAPQPDDFFAGTQTVNDNVSVFGAASGFEYKADKRELKDKTSATTLIINGPNPRTGSGGIWTFNFCKLEFNNSTQIKLQNGAVARFLIDGDDRVGSGCDHKSDFKLTKVSTLNFDSATMTPGNPVQLQVLLYGDGRSDVDKESLISGALYAPGSHLDFHHDLTFVGGIVGDDVHAHQGLDFITGDLSGIQGTSTVAQPWARTTPGFVECRSAPSTTTDPESGC
jgi:hypothetical protein